MTVLERSDHTAYKRQPNSKIVWIEDGFEGIVGLSGVMQRVVDNDERH